MGGLFSHPLPVHIVALPPGKTFSDDDGEARAGGRLKSALKKRKAVGVACLVARWYGGVNIGKVGAPLNCYPYQTKCMCMGLVAATDHSVVQLKCSVHISTHAL